MSTTRTFTFAIASATLILGTMMSPPSGLASDELGLERLKGAEGPHFADPDAAVSAFEAALANNDFDGLARLLGLDPAKAKKAEGVKDRFAEIRDGAAKLVFVEGEGDQRVIDLGEEVWPFPFPLRKLADGKWAFDTEAGIEEIVNRRIGENELEAITTVHAYVEAQWDYASEDRDGDGVLEYAQSLVSSKGKTDGLYWPIEQGDGESPAGAFISEGELHKARTKDKGYFGYRFRILDGQGSNIAGGQYDYVINGNMIAGFALVAWPVKYGMTGVKTFIVNQSGIVYEKDLGPSTEDEARRITSFNPDQSWDVVEE